VQVLGEGSAKGKELGSRTDEEGSISECGCGEDFVAERVAGEDFECVTEFHDDREARVGDHEDLVFDADG
jgi:hypothetical protein